MSKKKKTKEQSIFELIEENMQGVVNLGEFGNVRVVPDGTSCVMIIEDDDMSEN